MTTMSCDDVSGGMDFCMDLDEFARRLGIKPRRAETDSPVKTPETPSLRRGNNEIYFPRASSDSPHSTGDTFELLKKMPRVPVAPNPYSLNEMLEHGQNIPLNDMYRERTQPRQDLQGETDEDQDLDPLIDLYSERVKRRRH
jgi:hypothetical protein